MEDISGARSLKTAATILRALRLLGDHPDGLFPAEIGVRLGKSSATARYMVNTLIETGYARRDPSGRCRLGAAPPWGPWVAPAPEAPEAPEVPDADAVLSDAVTELYRRTRLRAYAVVRDADSPVARIVDSCGHQGLARIPGLLTEVGPEHAHALGLTRALLATAPTYRAAVERDVACPTRLTSELAVVAARGWAVDEGGFAPGFATIAAPVRPTSGEPTVALGVSCSVRGLAARRQELAEAVRAVADRVPREGSGAPDLREPAGPPEADVPARLGPRPLAPVRGHRPRRARPSGATPELRRVGR